MASAFLTDGFPTTITFSQLPGIKLKEVSVKPPGVSGGGGVDQTNMLNTKYRTQLPKGLIGLKSMTGTFHYNPEVMTDLIAQVNVNGLITVTYQDGSTVAAFGWLDDFTPSDSGEGDKPTASCTFEWSLIDPATGLEAAPVVTPFA